MYEEGFKYIDRTFDSDGLEYSTQIELLFKLLNNIPLSDYYDRVEKYIKNCLSKNPNSLESHFLASEFYIRISEYRTALNSIQFLISKEPGNFYYREQLIFVLSYLNDHQRIIDKTNELKEKFYKEPLIFYFNGYANYMLKNYNEAITSLKDFLKYTDSQDNKELESIVLSYMGEIYHNTENFEKSDFYYGKAIEKNERNFIALNNYAYFLSQRDVNLKEAKKYSRSAITNDPSNFAFLDTFAWINYKLNNFEVAYEYIIKSYRNGGNENSEVLDHYGDILFNLGKIEEAVKKWEKAIELGGNIDEIQRKISDVKFQ